MNLGEGLSLVLTVSALKRVRRYKKEMGKELGQIRKEKKCGIILALKQKQPGKWMRVAHPFSLLPVYLTK
jgi:hypothetical protein